MSNHRFDPGLIIRCGINSCPETYRKFESFRSHIYRKHREVLGPDGAEDEDHVSRSISVEHEAEGEQTSATNSDDDAETTEHDNPAKRSAALFLLKTCEERKVTQTALNGIVQDVQVIWRDAMDRLKVSYIDALV